MEIFQSRIDQKLLHQMKDLIIRMADKSSRGESAEWNCLFEEKKAESSMEEQYGLKYPGEVLERYEERCGKEKNQTLALALALAETKPILNQAMFVGSQYKNFIRKVRKQAEDDFLLSCILYLLTEGADEEVQLYDRIMRHTYANVQEVIFAAYVLQNRADAWDIVKTHSGIFRGNSRTYKVYGNLQIYVWVLQQFYQDIRKCRQKDIYILKVLLELPCKYVKKDSELWGRLGEAGYSDQEILYLNLSLPGKLLIPKVLNQDSITMERMALAGVRELLEAETIENASLFSLCRTLIKRYRRYDIRLEGRGGILESLGQNIRINDKALFQYLYKRKAEAELPESWFYADFGRQEWCGIHEWMGSDEFIKLFGDSMITHSNAEIDIWLENYRMCIGKSYGDFFWNSNGSNVQEIFQMLISKKRIDLETLLDEYAEDEKQLPEKELSEKWSVMRSNISSAVSGLDSHEAYLFWEAFDKRYGILKLDAFLLQRDTVLKAVRIDLYYQHFERMDFKKKILFRQEQSRLFEWVEQEVYRKLPERYEEFLCAFLMKDIAKLIFPKESRELFDMIRDDVPNTEIYALCRKYYTESEWKSFQEKEDQRKAEQERKEKRERLEAFKNEAYKKIRGFKKENDVFEWIADALPHYYGGEKEKVAICLDLLVVHMNPVGLAKKETIVKLAERLFHQFEYGRIQLKEVLDLLGRMEVIEDDEPAED